MVGTPDSRDFTSGERGGAPAATSLHQQYLSDAKNPNGYCPDHGTVLSWPALISAVTLALAVFRALSGRGGSVVGAWALGAGIGALAGLYAYIAYPPAFTEFTPARLPTPGPGGL